MGNERKNAIPVSVRAEASKIERELGTFEEEEQTRASRLLQKLLSDSRMEKVWREIYRKKQPHHAPTECFQNPARPGLSTQSRDKLSNKRDARADQDEAAAQLFRRAFELALNPASFATRADAQNVVDDLVSVANQLRMQADKLRHLGRLEVASELAKIAGECEEDAWSSEPLDDEHFVIERHRADDELRAYVFELADATEWLFGKPMYGTLTTMTQVALDRNALTSGQVREILRRKRRGI